MKSNIYIFQPAKLTLLLWACSLATGLWGQSTFPVKDLVRSGSPGAGARFPKPYVFYRLDGTLPPTITGLESSYCDLDEAVTLTGSHAPGGFFKGPGITDNGNGSATFDPGEAGVGGKICYLLTDNFNSVWVSVAGGFYHTVAIKSDGSLWAWGTNDEGELGTGNNTDSDVPVQIGSDYDWVKVSAGGYHTLALKADGTLWSWGWNPNGALGIGNNTDQNAPVQIGTDTDWADMEALIYNNIALKTDGTIWGWGWNSNGELGQGNTVPKNVPTQIGTDTDWASIKAAGSYSTIAAKTNGTLWGWGRNGNSELGINNYNPQYTPVQIGMAADWAKLSMGAAFTLGLKPDGTLWAWGINNFGQLGLGNTSDMGVPVQVGTDNDWADISAGAEHSLAVKADGSLWSWGYNTEGQLGLGNTTNQNVPTQAGNQSDWAQAFAVKYQSFGLKTSGLLFAWGNNSGGQLGDGSITYRSTPVSVVTAAACETVAITQCPDFTGLDETYCSNAVPVLLTGNYAPEGIFSGPGITDNGDGTAIFDPAAAGTGGDITYDVFSNQPWTHVSAGYYQTLALKGDGTLWGWGYNGYGVIGDGTYDDAYVPVQVGSETWVDVSAGYYHTIGIQADGTLWGWGYNYYGEIGQGGDTPFPVQIGTDNDWLDVEAGYYRSFGIKTDGTLWAWGYNGGGVLGTGNSDDSDVPVQIGTATNWASISTHSYADHVLATRTDGTLWAWGYNDYGQLGTGNNTSYDAPLQIGTDTDWQKADAGAYHSLAIKTGGSLWSWGYNYDGELGNGNNVNSNSPVSVAGSWSDVAAGYYYSLGVKTDGTLWGWGYGGYGNLGNGTEDDSNVPVQSGTEDGWSKVAGGTPEYFSFALKSDGNLFGFGYNGYGYLGNGSDEDSKIPVQVGEPVSAVTVSKPFTISPVPNGIEVTNASQADCNNTTCTEDDTFTADVTVTYDAKPGNGTLGLSGPTIVGTVPPVDVSGIGATSHTFTGVMLKSDGLDVALTATFSEGCSFENPAVAEAPSCGGSVYTLTVVTQNGNSGVASSFAPEADLYNNAPQWKGFLYSSEQRIRWESANSRWELVSMPAGTVRMFNTTGTTENLPCGGWQSNSYGPPIALGGGCGPLNSGGGSPPCAITGMSIGNMGNCNDNGTVPPGDDYFVAGDVAVVFAFAPASGNLVLKRGNTVLATKAASELSCTTEWLFLNVQMAADGQSLDLTAEFTGTDCTLTQNFGNAPGPCSCQPTSVFTVCPTAQSVQVPANSCVSAALAYLATANGNPDPAYTYEFSGATNTGVQSGTGSGSVFNKGVTNVTLTATNACGSATCQFAITVLDKTPPSITCPNGITVSCAGNVPAPNTNPVSVSDNCGAVNKEFAGNSLPYNLTCSNRYNITRYYRATDESGNSNTCSQVIAVFDNVQPVFTAVPANVTVQCNGIPVVGTATATDGCGGTVTVSYNGQTQTNGSCANNYILTRQWTATDACGNSKTATQKITVVDLTTPTFVSVPANVTVQCNALPPVGNPVAMDGCSGTVSITYNGQTTMAGACPDTYTLTRKWTASDACGNTRTATQRITVVDTQKPAFTAVPANTTIECSDPVPPAGTPTATDNCDATVTVALLGQYTASAPASNAYLMVRVWKATDNCGNFTTASQVITVQDTQKPVFTSVPAHTTIECSDPFPVSPGTATATDNCDASVQVSFSGQTSAPGACPQSYVVTRSWVAYDDYGNTQTATQTITIVDTKAPVFTNAPANISIACGAGLPPVPNVAASDACDNTAPVTYVGEVNTGPNCPYTVSRTWTAADDCGNVATYTQIITVSGQTFGGGGSGLKPSTFNLELQTDPRADAARQTGATRNPQPITLQLAPNPATDEVWLSFDLKSEGDATLLLFDASGRLALRQDFGAVAGPNRYRIDLAGLPSGVYALQVLAGRQRVAERLVVFRN